MGLLLHEFDRPNGLVLLKNIVDWISVDPFALNTIFSSWSAAQYFTMYCAY